MIEASYIQKWNLSQDRNFTAVSNNIQASFGNSGSVFSNLCKSGFSNSKPKKRENLKMVDEMQIPLSAK